MHQITLIRKTLQPHLVGWHGARVTFLALFTTQKGKSIRDRPYYKNQEVTPTWFKSKL